MPSDEWNKVWTWRWRHTGDGEQAELSIRNEADPDAGVAVLRGSEANHVRAMLTGPYAGDLLAQACCLKRRFDAVAPWKSAAKT